MNYESFIASKRAQSSHRGLPIVPPLNPMLFDFQKDIVGWALRQGQAAIFADCGMGKTPMQLEWARHVPGRVLIVAPLAVATQTEREGVKFDIPCRYLRDDDPNERIVITNYEIIERFDPSAFAGIVLDESSILKSYTGKFRTYLIEQWGHTPFRLAATATPAPNDYMELGNHSEFLGRMTRTEMLSTFFVHDGGDTSKWRLKGHAEGEFWKWLTSWAVLIKKPSDLGYDDGSFLLHACHLHEVVVNANDPCGDNLFALPAVTLIERRDARRNSIEERVAEVAALANNSDDQWLVWCDLNAESAALAKAIPDAVEVRGSDSNEDKIDRMLGFGEGRYRVLVSKPSICGFGMNFQRCAHMAFTGLSDSYEKFYQAIRRCWRFGQTREVNAYVVTSSLEGAVVANIRRKETDALRMAAEMLEHMHDLNETQIRGRVIEDRSYLPQNEMEAPSFLCQPY